jgi:ABC-type nickel/cobalt efflux system permease component RcnA
MTATGLLLGLLFGVRHALEPDHLAAVSVLNAHHPSPRRGAWLGASWGVGHSLALLVVAVILSLIESALPATLADVFELGVAIMLVGLGVNALRRAWREGAHGPTSAHTHGETAHTHATSARHVHLGPWTLATRPLLVGIVHGLAGSGALTAMVVAGLPSLGARLSYIALFGVGSVLGMAALSGLAGWPLARLARTPALARTVVATAGFCSAALGLFWGWPIAHRLLG